MLLLVLALPLDSKISLNGFSSCWLREERTAIGHLWAVRQLRAICQFVASLIFLTRPGTRVKRQFA